VWPIGIVQRGLRTPTGPFFARFFIGIIPGLVAEFAFMVPSTRVVLSSSAARLMGRKQIGGLKSRLGCSTGRHALGPWLLAAQPYVSIEALAALSALLDQALKDQTPSAVLLSGSSRASHDQNRGETHVTCDDKLRETTQSTIAPAASDRSVQERSVERRHRPARMAGAAGGSAAALTSLMTQLSRLAVWRGDGFALGERQIHHPNPMFRDYAYFVPRSGGYARAAAGSWYSGANSPGLCSQMFPYSSLKTSSTAKNCSSCSSSSQVVIDELPSDAGVAA
jgi:hypothetical protein